ncbi:sensor histidine kinase [Pontibacillus yanchengensis]|uniref:Histidine kinase n=1 Tax=Pontibacillus yanchengensis Y32 TaxID=1385514 RepID=A0A0A2TY98_9BACI|nr:ATP-binding protein [Pontibacillus yanchengensis]KGP74230.1 histidine kinase [Pontibacillus yanchengensis Y32]
MEIIRNKKILTTLFTSIIILLALYLLLVTFTKSYTGISAKQSSEGQWVVANVEEMGWGSINDIQKGDVILRVNDQPPSSHKPLKRFGVLGDLQELVIKRDQEIKHFTVKNSIYSETLIYHSIIPFLAFSVLFSFSALIYARKKEDSTALLLIAFFLAVGFGYLSAAASARTDLLARFVNGISLLMIPVLLLHFYYVYFSKYHIKLLQPNILYFLYSINTAIVVIETVYLYLPISGFYTYIRHGQLILFSYEIVLCLSILVIFYFRFRNTIHKPVFQNTIFAIVVSFLPFIVFTAIPSTFFGVNLLPPAVTAACIIFLPMFFVYQVLTNRLFDIDFINSRLRYYSFIASILTVIIVSLLTILTSFSIVQWIRLVIIFFVTFIAFFYFEERLNIRPRVFGEKVNYQLSLDQFSKDISKILKREELDERLIREVKTVLPVNGVSLLECQKGHSVIHLVKGDHQYPEEEISHHCVEKANVKTTGEFFKVDKGLCYVISEMNDSLHLLWIDKKMNHTPFNKDEHRWLKTLVHYTSIVYENFQLIEGVTEELKRSMYQNSEAPFWLLRLLFNLSEKERARLASDLHDAALQEQLVWYRKVEELLEEREIPNHVTGELTEVKEGLLDVVQQIRETCTFLRPPFLKESGIVEALNYLIDHYRLRCDFSVEFNAQQFSVELEHEQSLAIYRIVQELLNNATKHSQATTVEFDLKSEGGMVVLNYKDDGVGIPREELKKRHSESMGLDGIRQRVKSLQGNVEFYSPEEGGFEMAIVLQTTSNSNSYFAFS